jgi:uncharacterized protein (TIGR02266 family)
MTAKVRVVFAEGGARRQLLLENISPDGLFLRAVPPKPIGTRVAFEFLLRNGGEPIVGLGVVRWVEEDPAKPRGMGIQFLELNEEGRREISSVLALRGASSHR